MRRAVEAAQAAARIPDHPRLDQVFDVFAEDGSLWIVSELVPSRPLSALLAEKPLTPYRAAEVASDVLMALRVLHAHGWVHRNITARTVLVCDDGRVMLTGLAVGAAEEGVLPAGVLPGAARGAPRGRRPGRRDRAASTGAPAAPRSRRRAAARAGAKRSPARPAAHPVPTPRRRAGPRSRHGAAGLCPARNRPAAPALRGGSAVPARAGRRRAARTSGPHGPGRSPRTARAPAPPPGSTRPSRATALPCPVPAAPPTPELRPRGPRPPTPGDTAAPPGRIADPYGVRPAPWHGASPRPGQSAGGTQPPGSGRVCWRRPADSRTEGHAHRPGVQRTPPPYGRTALPPGGEDPTGGGRWDEPVAAAPARRGPGTALAAERARQARWPWSGR
ncbi:hypothetical protein SGLAM104S_06589 [Streptomyces glaucescens]